MVWPHGHELLELRLGLLEFEIVDLMDTLESDRIKDRVGLRMPGKHTSIRTVITIPSARIFMRVTAPSARPAE